MSKAIVELAMAFLFGIIFMNEKNLFKMAPAIVIMLVIFIISSQPSDRLPDFDWADKILKKGGHMLGYGLLALSYWSAFSWAAGKRRLVWILTILYACTDEFHQSLVPGRFASIWDVLIFDNLGAMISLWLAGRYSKNHPEKPPDRFNN